MAHPQRRVVFTLTRLVLADAGALQDTDSELMHHQLVMATQNERRFPLPALQAGIPVVVEAWPHQDIGWELMGSLPGVTLRSRPYQKCGEPPADPPLLVILSPPPRWELS